MAVERLTAEEVARSTVGALGHDVTAVDLSSPEVLASLLRRAASFTCPTSSGRLVRAVSAAVEGLVAARDDLAAPLEELVEALISYGDLLELPVVDETRACPTRQLFLGPTAFVSRQSGACLLIGIRPDGADLLTEELATRVQYDGHVRSIPACSENLPELLAAHGLKELQHDQWLRRPRPAAPQEVVDDYAARLGAAGPAGEIEEFRLIDLDAPVTYYRGRWRPPTRRDNGTFVGRRPQAYGADLWCFAQVASGEVVRLIDLPIQNGSAPGSDEAWRLQAALDAARGRPQKVRVRDAGTSARSAIDLFSPIPSWAQRRLDVIGTPLLRGRGALISYSVTTDELDEELAFLGEMMWVLVERP